jgi:hypothetical protein
MGDGKLTRVVCMYGMAGVGNPAVMLGKLTMGTSVEDAIAYLEV